MTHSTTTQLEKKRGRKKKVIKASGRRGGKGVRISAFLLDVKKYSRLRLGCMIAEIPETPVMPSWYQGRRVLFEGEEEGGLLLLSDIDYLELHMVLQGWFGEGMMKVVEAGESRGGGGGGVFDLQTYHSLT